MEHNRRELGQGLIEYAFIIVLVSLAVLVSLTVLGPAIGNVFSIVMTSI